ncbi:hypothetical protein PybrP1_009897 [[Pythium] brassicae (nom. inval.)]|nr:hypothetical protein PybrP1_009897 [[Pythium] brassicae (nom. inval.)]
MLPAPESDVLSTAHSAAASDHDDTKKKKPGRSPSQIWTLLTDEPHPQRRNSAVCKHCTQQVLYYKKSEQAIRHLKKCSVFQSNQHQYAFISQFHDVLHVYNQKLATKRPAKKRHKSGGPSTPVTSSTLDQAAVHHAQAMNQLAMQQSISDGLMDSALGLKDDARSSGGGSSGGTGKHGSGSGGGGGGGGSGGLSKSQVERMEEAIAMHAYVTGMAFDAVEEPHLQRALAILRPSVRLPDKKRLEGDLLDRCYEKMHRQVWSYLTASSTRVCLKRDAWSSVNLYNTGDPEEVYVTYMAVNAEKRFFLESEKVLDDDGQYNPVLIAQDIKRVMAPIVNSVSGVVTGSTEYHARAWELLKAEYPTKFFYGCISHALHLAIRDIFGPEKRIEHDPRRLTPQLPLDFPFQDLVDCTTSCNELLAFLSSYQYAPTFQLFDPQTLQTMKSLSAAAPTTQWGSLAARFRVLLNAEDTLQSIATAPDFVAAAPANQRATRESIRRFVTSVHWKLTLEKAISILTPIELTLYKFQDDKPISEVYFEAKHLLTDFDGAFGLAAAELEYIKKVVTSRWQYVLGEAHGLAFLLDPRYIGKPMPRDYREQIEELIFRFPETDADLGAAANEERKRTIAAEYTDYVIYAKAQRANRTYKWELLDKGSRSPLQFWLTEADDWPHLKALALTLFSLAPSSLASEQTLCKASLLQSSRRNKLGLDDLRRLAFISINDTQFTVGGGRAPTGDIQQHALPDFPMAGGDPGLSPEGMMMWMI